MPFVMNASSEEVQVKVHGKYFTFPSRKVKAMDPEKVFHLTSKCAYMGFVELSDRFEDPEYAGTEEGKAELADAVAKGVAARIEHLEWIKSNELQSLKSDVSKKIPGATAVSEMSPEALNALEKHAKELAGYRKNAGADEESIKATRLKEIEKLLE